MTKTIEEKRAESKRNTANFRAREIKKIHKLGYSSPQSMITRVLANDLTEKHKALIMKGMTK